MGENRLRGTLPDAVEDGDIYLIKFVSSLRATYQVRLCAFMASKAGKKLYLLVPVSCQFHPSLTRLMLVTRAIVRRDT